MMTTVAEANCTSACLELTFSVPSPVSSLALGSSGSLCVGSQDGTARWYNLPSPKVVHAIKSLGDEVSSVVWSKHTDNEAGEIWIASGRRAFVFAASSPKMICTAEDATLVLDLGEDDEDVLNELSLSNNGKCLAFSSDGGTIGVVDFTTNVVSRMKARHNSICGAVKFIPDRPSELLSGGYDSAVLHFDFNQGNILSRYDITSPPPSNGVSLSPPFVLSVVLSSTGVLAASTADGRVWLGGGGEKLATGSKKKRTRKWEGLREDEGLWLQVAEGPVVALAFSGSDSLMTCTLLGSLAGYRVYRDADGKLQTQKTWFASTRDLQKVNTMAADQDMLTVGGFGKDDKGVIEIWRYPQPQNV